MDAIVIGIDVVRLAKLSPKPVALETVGDFERLAVAALSAVGLPVTLPQNFIVDAK